MKKSGLKNAAVFAAFILAFVCSSGALALDATSFDPRNVSVEADSISGVPVGTIITWPVATNPEGWDEGKWLECNGQTISQTVYPELFALVGTTVPDLRGFFLRGVGGNAAGLGAIQQDAGKEFSGSFLLTSGGPATTSGGFTQRYVGGRGDDTNGKYGFTEISFSGAGAWGAEHVADEFRPINRAVRYLIRAAA